VEIRISFFAGLVLDIGSRRDSKDKYRKDRRRKLPRFGNFIVRRRLKIERLRRRLSSRMKIMRQSLLKLATSKKPASRIHISSAIKRQKLSRRSINTALRSRNPANRKMEKILFRSR